MFELPCARPGRLLRASNVARRLGVSPRTVRWYARSGRIPAFKSGPKVWFFHEFDVGGSVIVALATERGFEMRSEDLPLLQVRRANGEIKELTVGSCAGRTLIGIVITTAITVLLLAGVVTWEDVGPVLRHVVGVLATWRG